MKIGFITVHTKDVEASMGFYEKVLGFKLSRRFSPRPGMDIVFLDDGQGGQVELIQDGRAAAFEGEGVSLGFRVEDVGATEAHLKKHGVADLKGPFELGGGARMLTARDPNGLPLGFVQEAHHG